VLWPPRHRGALAAILRTQSRRKRSTLHAGFELNRLWLPADAPVPRFASAAEAEHLERALLQHPVAFVCGIELGDGLERCGGRLVAPVAPLKVARRWLFTACDCLEFADFVPDP
jgi:hypothetical protein